MQGEIVQDVCGFILLRTTARSQYSPTLENVPIAVFWSLYMGPKRAKGRGWSKTCFRGELRCSLSFAREEWTESSLLPRRSARREGVAAAGEHKQENVARIPLPTPPPTPRRVGLNEGAKQEVLCPPQAANGASFPSRPSASLMLSRTCFRRMFVGRSAEVVRGG